MCIRDRIKAYTVKDAVDSVTTKCMETFNENGKYHVALFDFGYNRNILRNLVKRGCKVTLVPGRTTAAELAAVSYTHLGLELTSTTSMPSLFSARHACVPE